MRLIFAAMFLFVWLFDDPPDNRAKALFGGDTESETHSEIDHKQYKKMLVKYNK